MSGASSEYRRTEDGCFEAPLVVSYPYSRTVGTTLSTFFTGLRDRRLLATRGADGRTWCPPAEFDPATGERCAEWVEVGPLGTVTTWSWQATPQAGQPLDRPFAWAMIRLDGADGELLHAVDLGPDAGGDADADPGGAPRPSGRSGTIHTGLRVRPRWAEARGNGMIDIVCFEPVAGDG